MAEYVEQAMQDMVPELDDLRRKRIFDDEEIRHIVRRRRDFEYQLHKTPSKPQDYLGYVRYEVALECLRARRSKALHWRRKTLSDFAGIRRLHYIFTRGVKKFKADKRFWYQYVDFCLRSGSTRILSKTLMRALKLHPREVNMWLLAADRELKCGHIKAARALLLRGLRAVPRSAKLWGELLRLEGRLACHLRATREGAEAEAGKDIWAPACLVLRRAAKKLEGSAQSLASFLAIAVACEAEALRKLPGEECPAELTAALRAALAAARPTAGADVLDEVAAATWGLWWRVERRAGVSWVAVTEAAVPLAPAPALSGLAHALAQEPDAEGGDAGPAAALAVLAAAPAAAADAGAAIAVLEAIERRSGAEDPPLAARLREAAAGLLSRAAEAHQSCVRLRLLTLRELPAAEAAAAATAAAASTSTGSGSVRLETDEAVRLLLLSPQADACAGDEALLEQLLRALRSGSPAGPLVGAFLAEALVRGRGAFDEACGRVQAIAGRLWEAPPLRAELLTGLLGAELRARAPAEAPVGRLVALFEEVLALLQDGDPEKVEWWLRYVEFSHRLGLHGRGGQAPAATDLHWRATRSVGDQPLYADRAHRLLGSAACG